MRAFIINFIVTVTLFLLFTTTVSAQTCNLENDGIEDCNESDCITNKVFREVGPQARIIFCQNNKKVVCQSSFTELSSDLGGEQTETKISFEDYRNDAPYTYLKAAVANGNCDTYGNFLTNSGLFETPSVNRTVNRVLPLGYTEIFQRVSQLLYATAVFLFVFLMVINGIYFVRSGNNPEELKKAKEGIFKTIAGFLFVLFSGGLIINIINSIILTGS